MKKFFIFFSIIACLSMAIYGKSFSGAPTHYGPYEDVSFKQVVIWGHKLHSHTHSYIHEAFSRAFKHIGYNVLWLDKNDSIKDIDFSQSLFITEGQVDQNIPIRSDSLYILHNCDLKKYQKLLDSGNAILLQVYTHDCLTRQVVKLDECIYYDLSHKTVYMPWATDLLPHEIDTVKKQIKKDRPKIVYFVGTIGGGYFGNISQIDPFRRACKQSGVEFKQVTGISVEENVALIKNSYMAPTLLGEWQIQKGYIPCRIFKNISYGQFGITNSETVYNLFHKKIVYNPDTYQLFFDADKRLKGLTRSELYDLMDFVKTKHTYLNRIDTLLQFFSIVRSSLEK